MFRALVARSPTSTLAPLFRASLESLGVVRAFSSPIEKKKVVVIGTGWAGFAASMKLDLKEYDLTVVSSRNHFLFTPLLASTTVGTLEFRAIQEPIRTARKGLNFFQAQVLDVDPDKKQLKCQGHYDNSEFTVPYDKLIIAAGAVANTFNIPGVRENTHFLRELSNARAVRNRIIECFERASEPSATVEMKNHLLHFVVVGGGPTSVETAGEIYDFLKDDVHKWYPDLEQYVAISLVEASNVLLGSFDKSLSEYTLKTFRRRKFDVRLGVSVVRVEPDKLILKDNSELPFGLCIWSTGVVAGPFIQKLPFLHGRGGRLLTDNYFRVLKSVVYSDKDTMSTNPEDAVPMDDVFAVGDCAYPASLMLAQTAQVANQSGKFVAKHLNTEAKGKPTAPFRYQHQGMLAYVGAWTAVSDLPQAKWKGFTSWLFWRSAYFTQLMSIKNKILVPMFWFKSFVFGRDISRF